MLAMFCDDFIKQIHNKGLELVPTKKMVILAEIVTRLSPHVELCCKLQKFTTFYCSSGDILYALSHALSQAKRDTCTMFHTAHVLNKHVQDTAAGFISYYRGNPDALASNSNTTDSIVSKVHPDLWRFFANLNNWKKAH